MAGRKGSAFDIRHTLGVTHAEGVQPRHHHPRIGLPSLVVLNQARRHGAARAQQVGQADAQAERGQTIGQRDPIEVPLDDEIVELAEGALGVTKW